MNVSLRIIDNAHGIAAAISDLANTRVMVGVPASKTFRKPEEGEPGETSPINNAELAYIHEHGAPEANIPARPFMQPGIESVQPMIAAGLLKAGEAAFAGKPGERDRQFNAVGLLTQAAIRNKITDGPFVPLALSTIKARARAGQKGAKQYLKLRGEGVPEDVLNDADLIRPLIVTRSVAKCD